MVRKFITKGSFARGTQAGIAELKQGGLSAQLLSRIQIENLTGTTIAPEKSPSLVRAFNLPLPGDPGIVHYLLFIASQRAGQLVPEFVWVNMSKSESDNGALRFVDQAGLFGDRQDLL